MAAWAKGWLGCSAELEGFVAAQPLEGLLAAQPLCHPPSPRGPHPSTVSPSRPPTHTCPPSLQAIIVEECMKTGGIGASLSAVIHESLFNELDHEVCVCGGGRCGGKEGVVLVVAGEVEGTLNTGRCSMRWTPRCGWGVFV